MGRLCFVLILLIKSSLQFNEEYHEELYIKPLPSGHVNTYFQFTTRWKLGPEDSLYHTHLIPRTVAEILQVFDVKELQISLTQGLWRYESWGYPVVDAPPGAETWAWFAGNLTNEDVNDQWKNLCSTLSGVLCTSLNFVDDTNSVEPKFSFRPRFGGTRGIPKKFIRYATLPREIVCTENLTPWKKLLPCNSKNGLASLLNSGHVHNTNYHSLRVSLRTLCDENIEEGCVIEFTESANFVYDTKLLGGQDFSIRKMFGQGIIGTCPLSKTSKIYADITEDGYTLTPEPTRVIKSERGGSKVVFAEYDIQKESPTAMFNVAWIKKQKGPNVGLIPPPPLYTHRYILSHRQERGKVVTKITNSHWGPIDVVLQENIPWFVPCYLHTLQIKTEKGDIQPKAVHFIPGQQREKAYHLEVAFTIPAKSWVQVSFDFEYIFLKWLEYPPDANHGHYLGSAVITAALPVGRNYTAIPVNGFLFSHGFNASQPHYVLQIHTESLILSLPTPDFSMPYNVICLACTVVALAFGPIHSVATKKIVVEKRDKPQSFFGKLKKKLFSKSSEAEGAPPVEGSKDNLGDH